MELNIKMVSLSDLKELKSIIEERLDRRKQWMVSQRGYSYDEYCKRELAYLEDENHEKLKRVNQRIEDFINAI
jgi:hypothetical protein